MQHELQYEFKNIFGGTEGTAGYFAPGRVNLIGEHTDYNGGHVFPCALTIGTYAVARRREDSKVRIYSRNFENRGIIEFDIDDLQYAEAHDWGNYPKGVIWAFKEAGYVIKHGMEILFYGNIPNGAGLSSSASIELCTCVILKDICKLPEIDGIQMAELSKIAENRFVGVNCGIMDQFAIAMGRENCAVLLDTNTLKYSYAPLHLQDTSIIISNTNKRRGLADSKYNERRSQCEEALRDLQKELSINSLGSLSEEEFENNKHLIKDPINLKRARHAVYENQRTIKAANALKQQDMKTFGWFMNESHTSLKEDYEVTGIELDTLVEIAWQQKGVIGSRMTGAGFGGCTVSIVENVFVDEFINKVGNAYKIAIGYDAGFYVVSIGAGARKI